MSKFTKGPWEVEYGKPGPGQRIIIYAPKSQSSIVITTMHYEFNNETNKANAHLISAAPTMYKALKNIINLPDNIACPSVKNFAREAIKGIAKAEPIT